MIEKLRRKMTFLVLTGLLVITALFVLSINLLNWNRLSTQAYATLELLSTNRGERPPMREWAGDGEDSGEIPFKPSDRPDWKPDEEDVEGTVPSGRQNMRGGLLGRGVSSMEAAGLSNFYTVQLDENGAVTEWNSDREELYTDEQVAELAEAAVKSGKEKGRVGTQFYQMTQTASERYLVVLDERLGISGLRDTLRATCLAGLGTWMILGLAGWILIRKMFVPVQEADERQRQFVWDASHELKTPLAVISANTEVLARQIGENEWLGYIQSEVERTNGLVQSLLTLARTDRRGDQVPMADVDLSQAVMSVALPFESTLFESGKTLETDVDEGVHVHGNEDMLRQLTVIFLSNAMKYGADGGTVRVSLHARGKGAVLSVFNTGPRIPDEDLEKIFDRFYRVEKSRNKEVEGYGLGLAIARNIVEMHRGRVQADSTDEGTTFTVALP